MCSPPPMGNTGFFLTVPRLPCCAFPGCHRHQAFFPVTQLSCPLVHRFHVFPILFLSVAKHQVSLSHLPQGLLLWEPFSCFSRELFCPSGIHGVLYESESLVTWLYLLVITIVYLSCLLLAAPLTPNYGLPEGGAKFSITCIPRA